MGYKGLAFRTLPKIPWLNTTCTGISGIAVVSSIAIPETVIVIVVAISCIA